MESRRCDPVLGFSFFLLPPERDKLQREWWPPEIVPPPKKKQAWKVGNWPTWTLTQLPLAGVDQADPRGVGGGGTGPLGPRQAPAAAGLKSRAGGIPGGHLRLT